MAYQSKRDWDKTDRDAWQRNRLEQEMARGLYKTGGHIDKYLKGEKIDKAEKIAAPVIKNALKPLNTSDLVHELIGRVRKDYDIARIRQVDNSAKITADDLDSSVFVGAKWKEKDGVGIATLQFFRGGDIFYDYEMSKDEFADFLAAKSLGSYFNDNIR